MNRACHYTPPGARGPKLYYYLHLPVGRNGAERWPVILFLHGSGERGAYLPKIKKHGLPKLIAQGQDLPAIVVSPQCPAGAWWTPYFAHLLGLLDEILATQPADPTRVYLTGLSMGGYACWELACRYPRRFAALVPICGGGRKQFGFPASVCALRRLPIWAFHGALDTVVPPRESETLITTLRRCGGSPRFTLYPDLAHNCWDAAYAEPGLMSWLLDQRVISAVV